MAKPFIITGLDIGSSNIKVIVLQRKSKETDFEFLGENKEISAGVRRGVVIDIDKVSKNIQDSLRPLEEQLGQKVNDVYTNIGGSHLFPAFSHGLVSVSRADQKVSQEDIQRVIQAAQTFPLPSNKEIVEIFPKEFIVDGEKGIKEPIGMHGVRLEVETLLVGGFSPYIKNLTKTILNSNLEIQDLIPSSLASARAVLNQREKELGVVLLDIGAGTTDLCVFEEGNLIHLAVFPIGSAHITQDIAVGFKIDIDTAEKIKLEFGSCLFSNNRKVEKIKIGEEEETLVFPRKTLGKIIQARLSEIFDLTDKELKKISRQGLLPSGVVLTGGGAKLPQIKEAAKKELKLPTRIGMPNSFSSSQNDPIFSTACGLALLGVDLEEEKKGLSFSGKGIFPKLKKLFRIFIP